MQRFLEEVQLFLYKQKLSCEALLAKTILIRSGLAKKARLKYISPALKRILLIFFCKWNGTKAALTTISRPCQGDHILLTDQRTGWPESSVVIGAGLG